ncbi:MAG: flagellar hook-length control protein FliK [Acidobacteriota bacterium]|nr:flagellar hook-length control protein FliK [Acidobacteriota bacterium]
MKDTIHYAQISSSGSTDSTWQKGNDPVANPPSSNPAAAAPLQQPGANSQSGTPATTSQKDVVSEARGIQTSGAVYASSGESAGNSDLSDSSASGQGKSGQQSGPGSGDNPSGSKPFVCGIANSPAVDSSANLLTAQTPTLPTNHTITSTPHTLPSASSNQPSATLSAWQNYDGGTGKIVRSASINDSAGGAEMHVELRSGALGPLEVHAVVREGSVGAEIHVQGQEAHTLLSAGLPSLERALGERNLRVENIAVYQDHAGGGMSGGERQGQHSDSSPSQQQQVLPWGSPPQSRTAARSSLEGEEIASAAAGLSVRA